MVSTSITQLRRGIRVFSPFEKDSIGSSVLLSTGTCQDAVIAFSSDVPYQVEAFLPNQAVKTPTWEEWSMLTPGEPSSELFKQYRSSSVGIIRIPKNVLVPMIDILESLELRSDTKRRCFDTEYRRILDSVGYVAANQLLLNHIRSYCLGSHDARLIGLHIQPAGLRTVTVGMDRSTTPPTRYRVGLHIDNWDQLPLVEKHQSRNRICINLGREDREFLFVNRPLSSMVRSLAMSGCSSLMEQENCNALAKEFMRHYPAYPVIRLRLAPGDAYIASTDNMIHDASSLGKRYADITWTALGYFGWADTSTNLALFERNQTLVSD